MYRTMEKLLRRCGMELTLQQQGESRSVWAFLQHAGSKSLQNSQIHYSQLGEVPGGYYLYIGPLVPVETGDVLVGKDKSYVFRQVETVTFQDKPMYLWGLCVEKGGEDTWGN